MHVYTVRLFLIAAAFFIAMIGLYGFKCKGTFTPRQSEHESEKNQRIIGRDGRKKIQTSQKNFAFAFAFAWCEWIATTTLNAHAVH